MRRNDRHIAARRALVPFAALTLLALLAGCGGHKTNVTAPNFTANDLAQPSSDWATNGGSITNQRYSPLDKINTSNVAQLKGVWRTHMNGSGVAAKYSTGESQPVFYNGMLYVTTGNDDAFAIDVDSGDIKWEYKSGIDQEISTVCCGWLNRGVAIGDGRAYLGQLDGNVVALDQKTGKQVWKTHLVSWQRGYTITGAPLYLDGKLYIGVVGAEYGIRAFVQALDAKTGKQLWRFYTIAGPGEPGGNTWPKNSKVFLRGGASVWETPAVDPKLGLLYLSTGNAGSDWYGAERPGKNLFAASIVALDLNTGKLKWYFQSVHHDIWDYDSPSPVVLFDAGGKNGIAQASKTGWLYMLDRATGKPLYGIDEKPVPQLKSQASWPTQPIPRTGEFIPHGPIPQSEIARIKKETTGAAKKLPLVVANEVFTPPPPGKLMVYAPGPEGGVNWQPISYSPKTQAFYICSAKQTIGIGAGNTPFKVGKAWTGSTAFVGGGWPEAIGYFTAIDATSGNVKWQHRFPDPCYAGTTTTAGNLVFVGRNSGELQAYDARNGKQLWSFQTGAGANADATVFEWKGKEYVAFVSAGNSLMATPHGDSVWLFGLNGTVGPAPAPGKGQGTEHAGEGGGKQAATSKGDVAAGKQVFASNCSVCHGALGTGGNGGPDLTAIPSAKNRNKVISQVENGGGGMPPFKGQLTPKQISDVAAYVTQKIATKKK